MHSVIDHRARQILTLNLREYTVADYIHQLCTNGFAEIKPGLTRETLGTGASLYPILISLEKKGCITILDGQDRKNIKVTTTELWIDVVVKGEVREGGNAFLMELTQDAITYINQNAGRRFDWKLYTDHVQRARKILQKRYPNITEERIRKSFQAVIDHKIQTWGKDPKMREYLTPVTLFRPTKFLGYLGEVKEYLQNRTNQV